MTDPRGERPVPDASKSETQHIRPLVVNAQLPPKRADLLEIVSKIMGIVLPIVLYFATSSFNHQQVDLQRLEHRQSIDEENRGRVMERLVNLGDSSPTTRLAAAKALRSYADMGRLDVVSVPGILPYLKSECDPETFKFLKEAVVVVVRNSAQTDSGVQNQHPELLRGIDSVERNPQCPKATSPTQTPPATSTTVVVAPPHYFDVGCAQANSGVLDVPIPTPLQENQKVQNVSASFVNIDNLKAQSVSVLSFDGNGAKLQYMLVGLDRQFFGNCPGGGHGTIVTNFVIGPR